MADHNAQPRLARIHAAGTRQPDKLRWSLRQRLCEQLRPLCGDFFDVVDDFLFSSGPRGHLGDDGAYLRAMREIRAKRELFEDTFLSGFSRRLQADWQGESADGDSETLARDAVFERLEMDLALQAMLRKARKHYATVLRQLEELAPRLSDPGLPRLHPEFLLRHVCTAFDQAQATFAVTLEVRLVLCKLFEQHLLLKLEKLHLDTLSILQRREDPAFVDRLYAASTAFRRRQQKSRIEQAKAEQAIHSQTGSGQRTRQVEAKVDEVMGDLTPGPQTPAFIVDLLRTDWRRVLVLVGLNAGFDSAQWQEAIETPRALLDLAATPNGGDADAILTAVRKGLALIQMTEDARAGFESAWSAWRHTRSPLRAPARPAHTALGVRGRTLLGEDDLNEIADLLAGSGTAESTVATPTATTLAAQLVVVDALADGTTVHLLTPTGCQAARVQRSQSVDNSYQVCDPEGCVRLTRSRVGLAISLLKGELRLTEPTSRIQVTQAHVSADDTTRLSLQ